MKAICAGTHLARCHQVIDLGSQFKQYKDNPPKRQREVWIGFEFPDLLRDETSTYRATVGGKFTFSLGEKARLRHLLESWRGKPYAAETVSGYTFDRLRGLLLQPALVALSAYEKGGKVSYGIQNVMPLMDGQVVADVTNKPAFLNLQDEVLDWGTLNDLPPFLRDWVKASPEYTAHNAPAHQESVYATPDDDLPF